jgi:hypothetical protein
MTELREMMMVEVGSMFNLAPRVPERNERITAVERDEKRRLERDCRQWRSEGR